ncbi:MAG: DMT family transporter [Angustibacter sp.]
MRPGDLLGVIALAGLWGSNFLFTEYALAGLSAAQIVLVRLFFGGAILLTAALALRARLPTGCTVLGRLLLMGLIGQAFPWLLFTLGQEEVPSSLAGVYTGVTPLLTIPVTMVMLRTRSSRAELAAVGVGFAGLLIVLSPWAGHDSASLRGQVLCLLGAFCYALAFGYVGRLLRSVDLPKVSLAAAQALLAGVVMVPVSSGAAVREPALTVPVTLSASVLALSTAVAFLINYWVISRVGPVQASLAFYLIPVVAVVLGIAFLDERLTAAQMLGGLIIVGSLALLYAQERAAVAVVPQSVMEE